MANKKRILVDMDDTLADFEGELLQRWRRQHPGKLYIPVEQRNTFRAEDQYPAEYSGLIKEIYTTPGFFRWLPPIEGGIDAMILMRALGHDVYICTGVLPDYENCVGEKYEWIERHLGREWTKRMLLTGLDVDKRIVSCDMLIDDNPNLGPNTDDWEHILYDISYNRHITDKRRLTWQNWKGVLGIGARQAPKEKGFLERFSDAFYDKEGTGGRK
jgi:5'-nucleotidase